MNCSMVEWCVMCTYTEARGCDRLVEAHILMSKMTGDMYPHLLQNCLVLIPEAGVMSLTKNKQIPGGKCYVHRMKTTLILIISNG